MRLGISLAALCALSLTFAGCAPSTPGSASVATASAPEAFSAERLARIEALLQQYVDEERIAGAVALVLRDGEPVFERAVGWRDKEAGDPMQVDTIFRIASQTKALTSAAVLALMEEGKLRLNGPVSEFIPGFAKTTVAVPGGKPVPAVRPITIRDLLTHTAGISYGTEPHLAERYAAQGLGPAAGFGWYTADKDEPVCETMERLATLPFAAQPGERFVYGYATDVLGCVVERASGMSLDEFLRTRFFEPLGMRDTHFFLPEDKRERLAVVYARRADGTIERAPEGARGQGHYLEGPRKSFSGGAGLLSTAHDYARFLEMIRNDGVLDGARILAPRTVALMRTNQLEDAPGGRGFGFGFQTVERYGANGMDAPGAHGWGGAYSTTYRIDPEARLVMVLMLQLLPGPTDLGEKFPALVHQALLEPLAGT